MEDKNRPQDPSFESQIQEQKQETEDQLPFIEINSDARLRMYQDHRATQLTNTTARIAEVRSLLAQMGGKKPSFDLGSLHVDEQFLKGMGKVAESEYSALSKTNDLGHQTAKTIVEFNKSKGGE